MSNDSDSLRASYDSVAAAYVEHLYDELWGQPVSLDFRFLVPGDVIASLHDAGFTVTESIEREPYEGKEHPSRRCYLFARVA